MQLKNHNYLYKQSKLKFARKSLSFLPCRISKWQALLTQSFLQIPKFKRDILKNPLYHRATLKPTQPTRWAGAFTHTAGLNPWEERAA